MHGRPLQQVPHDLLPIGLLALLLRSSVKTCRAKRTRRSSAEPPPPAIARTSSAMLRSSATESGSVVLPWAEPPAQSKLMVTSMPSIASSALAHPVQFP